jgi:predicted nucleotidyltransferase
MSRYLKKKWYNLLMISESDKKIIQEFSKKYHVKRVLLFGSSLDDTRESRDIDLAVEGINPKDFFKYYGDLLLSLSKPVDLVDLSEETKFISLVKEEGVPIYG